MSIGEPIWAFYGFIKAERPRIIAEVAQREGPNTELFDLADDLVVRGPSGEVERFVDALHKAIMMRVGEINAMHERDLLRQAEWEMRWLVKMLFDKRDVRDMETVEVFARDLARKNALEYDGRICEDDTYEEIRALMEERLGSKRRWNAWKRTQREEAGEAGESEEPISFGFRFPITTARSASRFADSPRDAKGAERVPEATPPPDAAPDATDATDSSTECPPPAETCSTRGFEDDVSFWFGDDVSGVSGSTASARPSRIPFADPGFPFPGRADVKTSNRARARNRVDERVRQPNQAMRPLSVRVMSLFSSSETSEKREREDATTARSPEGDGRAVGYEPVADGADGDVAVAEHRRDPPGPAAEATRREDVGDAAEPSRDGDAGRKAERKAKAGGESRGESQAGGLYGFAKKAHVFLVERAARASAALAALFLSRAFFSPAGKRVDREDGVKAVEVMRRKTS